MADRTPSQPNLREAALALFDPMDHGSPSHPNEGHTVETHCAACVAVRSKRTQAIRRALQANGDLPAIGLRSQPDLREALLDGLMEEVIEAVQEGDAQDCSSPDCIANAVYEIVRHRLAALASQPAPAASEPKPGDEDYEAWVDAARHAGAAWPAPATPSRPDLREAAQAIVDDWDDSLALWLAAGEEEGDDGPAMTALRDPKREQERQVREANLRAALAATPAPADREEKS